MNYNEVYCSVATKSKNSQEYGKLEQWFPNVSKAAHSRSPVKNILCTLDLSKYFFDTKNTIFVV